MRNSLEQAPWRQRFTGAFPADPILTKGTRQVKGALYSFVQPTPVPQVSLVAWSESLATELGLFPPEPGSVSLGMLGGNRIMPSMGSYATRYGGHQFGHWAGQLGDGRAIALGEIDLPGGEGFREIQLKGAGPTPYSRHADGRAVLRSSIREYLASEAMFGLGVPTTRALSLVTTGDRVERDMFYDGNSAYEPGAIVCRVSPSFVRFGHFEILQASGEVDLLQKLVLFIMKHHMVTLDSADPDFAGIFFEEVCHLTARLMVHWMRVGFVHGVMNTDNMSILGETIDYGPFGWLDQFDPHWTPNTTDFQNRRYRYGEQPRIGFWNLSRLGQSLAPLFLTADRALKGLDIYKNQFNDGFFKAFQVKLGLSGQDSQRHQELVGKLFELLERTKIDMTLFFRQLSQRWAGFVTVQEAFVQEGSGAREGVLKTQWIEQGLAHIGAIGYDSMSGEVPALSDQHGRLWVDYLGSLYEAWKLELQVMKSASGPKAVGFSDYPPGGDGLDRDGERLNRVNPKVILRNYLAQEVIDQALLGDYKPLKSLEKALQKPYDDTPESKGFDLKRPEWAADKPGCSALSCSS